MVLHFVRHVSLCLWPSLLITGLGSFWILSHLQPAVGAGAAPMLAAGLLAAVFAAVAWTCNRLGLMWMQRLVRRADRAEREGLRDDAERAFQSALGVLDSFWVSPGTRRRTLLPLAGRIARYYLSESPLSTAAEDFIARYLWAQPGDEEVAEQWMQHAERQGGLGEDHQDLGDRLADAHPGHRIIQLAVARLCLAAERTDYLALRTYRRACGADGGVPAEFCTDLERLFKKSGRADEWAHEAFRQAGAPVLAPDAPRAKKPPAPATRPPVDEEPVEFEVSAPDGEAEAAFRMSGAADEVGEDEEEERGSLIAQRRLRWAVHMGALVRQGAAVLSFLRERFPHYAAGGLARLYGIWGDPGTGRRRVLAVLLIAGSSIGIGWMALNLAGVFEPAPAIAPSVSLPSGPAPVAADQFALQVAAYLRQDYALKLVEDLKKKKLNAYLIETTGSGKTWYQVRIAAFPDPQSAREFGRELKWKGVIDDFYVTSASR